MYQISISKKGFKNVLMQDLTLFTSVYDATSSKAD